MTKEERALQIWPILVAAAHNRQVLTYEIVADLMGMGPKGKGAGTLAQPLGVIMRYCDERGLPPLTVLVVNKTTGQPGRGLKTVRELHTDREKVFRYEWYKRVPPRFEAQLADRAKLPRKAAVKGLGRRCPACGTKIFKRWPMGWDAHAAHACAGLSTSGPEARKREFKRRFLHLFKGS